ncbi:hypothetical protein B0F90DRAFT_1698869, partial [Multifurca ochricompacta]
MSKTLTLTYFSTIPGNEPNPGMETRINYYSCRSGSEKPPTTTTTAMVNLKALAPADFPSPRHVRYRIPRLTYPS